LRPDWGTAKHAKVAGGCGVPFHLGTIRCHCLCGGARWIVIDRRRRLYCRTGGFGGALRPDWGTAKHAKVAGGCGVPFHLGAVTVRCRCLRCGAR
jgi:hypothetical protein